jgi:hypothetical protein
VNENPESEQINFDESQRPANYILGGDDQITVYVSDVDELNSKPVRIDMKGDIYLPMAGPIDAAGLTADQLDAAIETQLVKFLKDPEVVVSVSVFHSQRLVALPAHKSPRRSCYLGCDVSVLRLRRTTKPMPVLACGQSHRYRITRAMADDSGSCC